MKKITLILLMCLMSSISQARDYISIVGSSTVYPFATVVAERLGKSGIKTPVIESTGTGGGFKLFCKGIGLNSPDMANASRAIKQKEKDLCTKNGVTSITEVIIGLDGIAFSSSSENKQYNFTIEQLWLAMAKHGPKPKNWKELDPSLPDLEIAILIPPPTSGTRDAWNSLVMKKGCPKEIKEKHGKKACALMREDGAMIEAGENDTLLINKIKADPKVFAIFGFSYFDNNRDGIIANKINGVEISLKGIQDGSYPISRPLYFYIKDQHRNVVPGINEYEKEFKSRRAVGRNGYLIGLGLVPLK
jgi:phosphate transport system substrate-binding protein|tara:strand:- start:648 stop:1559 length:912 start_codon:yes stop_codon:yes gene_type:complete